MFITGNSQMINPGTIYNLMATYLISIYQTETIDSTALLGFSLFSFIFMTVPCVFFTEILITTQYVFLVQEREYNWHCWTILISLGGGVEGREGVAKKNPQRIALYHRRLIMSIYGIMQIKFSWEKKILVT